MITFFLCLAVLVGGYFFYGRFVEREIALIKIKTASREEQSQLIQLVGIFEGKIVSVSTGELAVELTGRSDRVDNFIALVREFGIVDMARSGRVAIARCAGTVVPQT